MWGTLPPKSRNKHSMFVKFYTGILCFDKGVQDFHLQARIYPLDNLLVMV